jgi:hypothetical protein
VAYEIGIVNSDCDDEFAVLTEAINQNAFIISSDLALCDIDSINNARVNCSNACKASHVEYCKTWESIRVFSDEDDMKKIGSGKSWKTFSFDDWFWEIMAFSFGGTAIQLKRHR